MCMVANCRVMECCMMVGCSYNSMHAKVYNSTLAFMIICRRLGELTRIYASVLACGPACGCTSSSLILVSAVFCLSVSWLLISSLDCRINLENIKILNNHKSAGIVPTKSLGRCRHVPSPQALVPRSALLCQAVLLAVFFIGPISDFSVKSRTDPHVQKSNKDSSCSNQVNMEAAEVMFSSTAASSPEFKAHLARSYQAFVSGRREGIRPPGWFESSASLDLVLRPFTFWTFVICYDTKPLSSA